MSTATKPTHTPGPWAKDKYGQLRAANGEYVLVWDSGIGHDSSRSVPESEANGRLMTAAPELLERLEMLHRVFLQRDLSHDDIQEANLAWIAIRKAKGEL